MKVPGKACTKHIRQSSHSRRDPLAEQQLEAFLVSYFAGDGWEKVRGEVVKLVDEIGLSKASSRLGLPVELLYDWVERVKFSNQPAQTEKKAQALAKKGLAHAKDFGWFERKVPQRRRRFEKNLPEFFLWRCGGDDKQAKKELSIFKRRGVRAHKLFPVADELNYWLRMKRKRSARKNLKKANKAKRQKAQLKRQREKQRKQEEKRRENERINRAHAKLILENLGLRA